MIAPPPLILVSPLAMVSLLFRIAIALFTITVVLRVLLQKFVPALRGKTVVQPLIASIIPDVILWVYAVMTVGFYEPIISVLTLLVIPMVIFFLQICITFFLKYFTNIPLRIIIAIVLILAYLGLVEYPLKQKADAIQEKYKAGYFCSPSEYPCTEPTLRLTEKPSYIELDKYNIEGTGGYECSKSIQLVSNTLNLEGQYVDYKPLNIDEANLFCHMTYVIEYKGKIKVLQKPEVIKLIEQYPYKDVSIKALEFKYIQDKEFVHRLLPMYANKEIGCIIVLDTPGEDKVYLEDEDLETFEEFDYQTFANLLKQVSSDDRSLFYNNLN